MKVGPCSPAGQQCGPPQRHSAVWSPPRGSAVCSPPEALSGVVPPRGAHADAQANLDRTLSQQEDWHLHTACVKMYMNAVGVHTMDMISFTTDTYLLCVIHVT